VDLKIDHLDQASNHFTRIDQRAISSDVDKIINVARVYCETLLAYDIRPTLKHFPGLGRVAQETHFVSGTLECDRKYLEQNDWRPFREISTQTSPFIMLGHVRVPSIDPRFPASLSSAIITDIIRKDWRYDGILITDDFNMGAVAGRREGIGNAAVRAVNAGADLILLSYDGSQYYPVMYAMINAYRKGRLNLKVLNQSRRRICMHRPKRVGKAAITDL
jgi:beta-N-acetylhexosaminidase